MTCDDAIKAMTLFLYGELEFDEEEGLQSHLDDCKACQEALARQRALRAALDERELDVSTFLLRRNRQQLGERLAAETSHGHGWTLSRLFGGWDWMPRFVRPAGAVALMAVGFFAAQVTPGWRGTFQSAGLVDPNTAHVRYVEPADNGRIQIVVDETHSRVISGKLDDEPIRRLLISAAKDPADPGLRGESVEILKNQTDSGEIRSALLNSLQHDSNGGVRLKALEALRPYAGHPEVRKVLADVLLRDDNPGVRTQAIDLLTQNNREDQLVGLLQELMRTEQNSYVRDRCQRVLKDMKASVETY